MDSERRSSWSSRRTDKSNERLQLLKELRCANNISLDARLGGHLQVSRRRETVVELATESALVSELGRHAGRLGGRRRAANDLHQPVLRESDRQPRHHDELLLRTGLEGLLRQELAERVVPDKVGVHPVRHA